MLPVGGYATCGAMLPVGLCYLWGYAACGAMLPVGLCTCGAMLPVGLCCLKGGQNRSGAF